MPTTIPGMFHGHSRGTAATPGYFIASTPFAGTKTSTAGGVRGQSGGYLSGGIWYISPAAINDEWTEDHQVQNGTYKVAAIYAKDTNRTIISWQFDGSTFATIDSYAAAGSNNNYSEVTGVAVTVGLKVVKAKAASKNASSTGYEMVINTYALVRTGS